MTAPNETRVQAFILAQLSREPRCAVLMPDGKMHGDPNACAIFWRLNTGAARTADRVIRFGIPGQADITGVVRGRRVDIEIKSSKGKQSMEQIVYESRITSAGGLYVLARGIDEVLLAVRGLLA